jgi:multiple sugar transport system permease protein
MSDVEWRSPGGRVIVIIFFTILIITSLVFLFPFVFTFTAGLKTSSAITDPGLKLFPTTPEWKNFLEVWQRYDMIGMYANTFYVAIGTVFGKLLVSSMAAYSISRMKPVGKRVIEVLIMLTLAVPMMAYLIPLYVTITNIPIIHISLVNTYWGLWLPYSGSAFYILVLKNSFDQIPKDIYDAASMDGASPIRQFFSMTLPLATPILIVMGLLTFVGCWGDFLLPKLVLLQPELQTISVRLYALDRIFPLNLKMAGAFIALLPPFIAVLIFQRYMKSGLTF